MRRPIVLSLVLTLTLIILIPAPATSQDADEPLLTLLNAAPFDIRLLREGRIVSYVDFDALATARAGVPVYETWADWNTAETDDDEGAALWRANAMRLTADAGEVFFSALRNGDQTPAIVGFDLFAVDQALRVGGQPTVGTVLLGDFNAEDINAALLDRGYAQVGTQESPVWRRADGQDDMMTDLDAINLANPFGGQLGRMEPLALLPDMLVNATAFPLLENMLEAATDADDSLADNANYRAAAEAVLDGDGLLVQALFLDAEFFGTLPLGTINMTEPQSGPAEPDSVADYGTLPVYTLAVVADRQEGDDQVIRVGLVYSDEATAQAAAEELTQRILSFPSVMSVDPLPLVEYEQFAATVEDPRVYVSADQAVALATIRYPLPGNTRIDLSTGEPVTDPNTLGGYVASGLLFRQFVQNIYNLTFYPIVVTTE